MFFFKLLLIRPTRKLAIKRGTFFISYIEYKIRKFLFIYHKLISSFVHLTPIVLEIKEVKHSTETAITDSKPEDLHDVQYTSSEKQTKFTIHPKKEWKSFH